VTFSIDDSGNEDAVISDTDAGRKIDLSEWDLANAP
jgi:hypothetical protein